MINEVCQGRVMIGGAHRQRCWPIGKIPSNPTVDQSPLPPQYKSDVIHAMLCPLFSKHVRLDMLSVC